jgi:hypothetical protein
MTFLELCKQFRQSVGASGSGPVTVMDQSGEYARLVSWIQQAWREIQLSRHWRFEWAEASVGTLVGFRECQPPSDLSVWDAFTLKIDGKALHVLSWSDFRQHYQEDAGADYPSFIAQKPDGTLILDAAPRQDGLITFEYWRTPQVLVESSDVPRLPERYHMVIVYRAMLFYALYENAPEVLQAARSGEARILNEMVEQELPKVTNPEPLA